MDFIAGPSIFQFQDSVTNRYLVLDPNGSFKLDASPNTLQRRSYYYVVPSFSQTLIVANSTGPSPDFERRYFTLDGWTTNGANTPRVRVIPGKACATAHVQVNNAFMQPPGADGKLQLSSTPYDWKLAPASPAFRMKDPQTENFIACDRKNGKASLVADEGSGTVFEWFNGNIFRTGSLRFDKTIQDYTASVFVLGDGQAHLLLNVPSKKWPAMYENTFSQNIVLANSALAVSVLSVPNASGNLSIAPTRPLNPVPVDIPIESCFAHRLARSILFPHPGQYPFALRGGNNCQVNTSRTAALATTMAETPAPSCSLGQTSAPSTKDKIALWLPISFIILAIVVLVVCVATWPKNAKQSAA